MISSFEKKPAKGQAPEIARVAVHVVVRVVGGYFRGPRMLRLTARYADQWNTVWLGRAQELAERLPRIEQACAEVGRDPATLAVTVGVQIVFPILGETNTMARNPLSGSAEELAQAFHEYDQAGAAHLMVYPSPAGLPALERVAEAVQLYRSAGGSG